MESGVIATAIMGLFKREEVRIYSGESCRFTFLP